VKAIHNDSVVLRGGYAPGQTRCADVAPFAPCATQRRVEQIQRVVAPVARENSPAKTDVKHHLCTNFIVASQICYYPIEHRPKQSRTKPKDQNATRNILGPVEVTPFDLTMDGARGVFGDTTSSETDPRDVAKSFPHFSTGGGQCFCQIGITFTERTHYLSCLRE
jgi:hypothetical protein